MNDVAIDTKDSDLLTSGATRPAYLKVLVDALQSNKIIVDKYGREHVEEDTPNRLKAAEVIARLLGDLKAENIVDNRKQTNIQQIIYVREDSTNFYKLSTSRLPEEN